MFCGKCGAKIEENVEFCTNCGAKLEENDDSVKVNITHNRKKSNRRVGIIAVVIIVIAAVIVGSLLLGNKKYKTIAEEYVDALYSADIETMIDLWPDEMVDYIIEEDEYEDVDEMIDDGYEYFMDLYDTFDRLYGEDWEYSYEILDVENVKGDDLDEIRDEYEDIDIDVSSVKNVEMKITFTGTETESSGILNLNLIKVDGSWYVDQFTSFIF